MSKLKPCPFCGNTEPGFERVGTPRQSCIVACGGCGARHESGDEGENSGTSWNRRAQPAQAGQVLTDDEIDDVQRQTNTAYYAGTLKDRQHSRAIEQAVLAKRVPQWLPIETAPKGQRVMVWIADKEAGENIAFAKVWFHADGTLGGGAEGFNGKWDLTHWMKLPEPPNGKN